MQRQDGIENSTILLPSDLLPSDLLPSDRPQPPSAIVVGPSPAASPTMSRATYFWLVLLLLFGLYTTMPDRMGRWLDLRQWQRVIQVYLLEPLGDAARSRPTPIAVVALRTAIVGQESSGSASVVNQSGSGAMGLAQVMPENVRTWSREALAREVSPREFLANPQLQVRIVDYKLTEYWQSALRQSKGSQDEAVQRVAAWWYSGNPALFQDTKPQRYNGDTYPSIAEYARSVLHRFKASSYYRIG